MKGGQFSNEPIVAILQQATRGEKSIATLCKEKGISEATFYTWRQKFAGMNSGIGYEYGEEPNDPKPYWLFNLLELLTPLPDFDEDEDEEPEEEGERQVGEAKQQDESASG